MYEIFSQVLELIFLISVLKPYLQSQASGDWFACSKDVPEEPWTDTMQMLNIFLDQT